MQQGLVACLLLLLPAVQKSAGVLVTFFDDGGSGDGVAQPAATPAGAAVGLQRVG